MVIDIPQLLSTYGLPGLLIGVLLYAVRAQWLRNNDVQDARIEDGKAEAIRTLEITRTLERAIAVVEGRSRA